MKKLYTLAFVALSAIAVNAQTNLVPNGGFETWTNTTTPQGFELITGSASSNNFLTQEITNVHSGTYSVAHQSQTSTQYIEPFAMIDVVPGHSYTMTYWFLDNSTTAKSRIWAAWLPATGFTAIDADTAVLRPNTDDAYSVDSPQWVQKTVTITAPATATRFRFQIRTYRETTGAEGGFIYYDDFSFVDNTTAGVKQSEIAGLKMYPNPLTGNILKVTSSSNAVKTVAVFDVLGKQVINTTTANGEVNASALNAGVYIVKITEAGKTATKKLVVR